MLHSCRSIARSLEDSFELTSCKCVSFGRRDLQLVNSNESTRLRAIDRRGAQSS